MKVDPRWIWRNPLRRFTESLAQNVTSHLAQTRTLRSFFPSCSNEILGAECLRHADIRQAAVQGRVLCPNLRWVIRDAAHASRRIYGRPALADPVLRQLIKRFALGPNSMSRRIQNSRIARTVLAKYIRDRPRSLTSQIGSLT